MKKDHTTNRDYKKLVYNLNGKVVAEITLDHKDFTQRIDGKDFELCFFLPFEMTNKQLENRFKKANEWADKRLEIMNKHSH